MYSGFYKTPVLGRETEKTEKTGKNGETEL